MGMKEIPHGAFAANLKVSHCRARYYMVGLVWDKSVPSRLIVGLLLASDIKGDDFRVVLNMCPLA